MVFLGSSCRETAKNAIKKIRWEKTKGKKFFFSQLFRPKVFDIDFPQKVFYGVFELPLPRKKSQGKKSSDGGWVGLRFSKCTGGSVDFFLAAPRIWGVGFGARVHGSSTASPAAAELAKYWY